LGIWSFESFDPLVWASYDLCLYLEQVVRGFSRYHKYTLGADIRDGAMTMPLTPARCSKSIGFWSKQTSRGSTPRKS